MIKIPVSVIIPCFNCSKTIERCIKSVLDQSARPEEIIIVDDCSSDDTLEIIKSLQSQNHHIIKLIVLPENLGPGTARNIGWDSSCYKYVAFLDSDDTWHPRKLEIQYNIMEEYFDIDVSGHRCIYIKNDKSLETEAAESFKFVSINRFFLLFKNPFSTPTIMLKKTLPHRFDNSYRYAEDIFLWQRLAFANFKVVHINSTLAYVHKPFYGASGLSAKLWEMEKGELRNFLNLKKAKLIGWVIYFLAVLFSLMKYFRRLLLINLLR